MKKKRPLKKFLSGMEFEFFIVDSNGQIMNKADLLIKKAKQNNPNLPITKEIGNSMIEINGYPKEKPEETLQGIMEAYKVLISVAHREDLFLCPLGCYPGKFKPKMRTGKVYDIKKKILGEKFPITGTVCGLHYHYTMPKGIFDKKTLKLKKLVRSELKQSLMSSYNLMIALDPAITTIMASSPFYMGKYYGKDSRVFWYRGGKKLKFMKGLYSEFLSLGGLPPYKQTLTDLSFSLYRRNAIWEKEGIKTGCNNNFMNKYKSDLDIAWNPVRLNKHDTLEHRGMDINYLDSIMGISTLLNFTFAKVQKDLLVVVPSDIGKEEPFKIEGNIMYIPPHTHVRNHLQYLAAKDGFDNEEIRKYCGRFIRLARKLLMKEHINIAKPVFDIYNEKESLSDKILQFASKKGFEKIEELDEKLAHEIAINAAEESEIRVFETEKLLSKMF